MGRSGGRGSRGSNVPPHLLKNLLILGINCFFMPLKAGMPSSIFINGQTCPRSPPFTVGFTIITHKRFCEYVKTEKRIQSWEVQQTKSKVEDKLIGQFYFLFFVSQCKTHRIELRTRSLESPVKSTTLVSTDLRLQLQKNILTSKKSDTHSIELKSHQNSRVQSTDLRLHLSLYGINTKNQPKILKEIYHKSTKNVRVQCVTLEVRNFRTKK
jgi:hypothetical protein